MISAQNKRKMNPMLLNVLLISGGIHLLALFVLGSITVYKYIIPDEAQFEEPPEMVEEQPPPNVKVVIKPQPASQQQAMNKLRMKQVGNISVDSVDVELPSMEESFTVSAGLGSLGGGSLFGGTRGNIGIGMSDVSIFGLKTRAERILFVINADRMMVTDKKGGLNSYKIIKEEITAMVGNLSAGTLFNVMLFDGRRTLMFKDRLVPSGQEIQQELVHWIAPINSNAQSPGLEGVSSASVPKVSTFPDHSVHSALYYSSADSNEVALLTQESLEQGVDAIFIITGYHRGFERLRRPMNEGERADWQRTVSSPSYQKQHAAHILEVPIMQNRVQEELAKQNAARKARGQPPRVLEQKHDLHANAHELELRWKTPHPGAEPIYAIDGRVVEEYFKDLLNLLYTDKDIDKPTVNVVLFLAGDEEMRKDWEDQLKAYVRFFRGKYRIIRGLDEINSARSAEDTTN